MPQARGSASAAVTHGKVHLTGGATLPAGLSEAFIHTSRNVSVGTDPVDDAAANHWSARDAPPPLACSR